MLTNTKPSEETADIIREALSGRIAPPSLSDLADHFMQEAYWLRSAANELNSHREIKN